MKKNESISLINSDCLTALKDISSQSVDLILTDPPYNLGLFMQNRDTNLKKMRDNFFGAATDSEVQSFLAEKAFSLADGFSAEKVKIPNRKKIALVQDTFSKMSKQEKKEMFEYIKDYYPNLSLTNGKAQISNEEDLKNILYGLEERFYTTLITKEKRIANSITSAEVKNSQARKKTKK